MNPENDERSHLDLPRLFRNFLASLASNVAARASLFAIELSEAKLQVENRLLWLFFGLSAMLFSYLLILVGGIVLLSHTIGFPWYDLCLIAGPLHALMGFFFLAVARRKSRTPLFDASRKELEKDKEWLAAREGSK